MDEATIVINISIQLLRQNNALRYECNYVRLLLSLPDMKASIHYIKGYVVSKAKYRSAFDKLAVT